MRSSSALIVGFFAKLPEEERGRVVPLCAVRRSGEAKKEDVVT